MVLKCSMFCFVCYINGRPYTVDLHSNVNITIVTDAAHWEIPNERFRGLKTTIAKYCLDVQLLVKRLVALGPTFFIKLLLIVLFFDVWIPLLKSFIYSTNPSALSRRIRFQYGGRGFENLNGWKRQRWQRRLGCTQHFWHFRSVILKNMVKTGDISTVADGWREVFERSRLVPPPSQTVRLAAESLFTQSHGFQLSLSRLTAAHLPQVTARGYRWTLGRGVETVVFVAEML